ncbi:MAG: inositol 2-dehydrogenase [Acetobacteraceae bacterium]|nr:inositol 2-dehydrogenase [Acetobacteraceae bacterium]
MLAIAQFGAGRIGAIHAGNVAANARARLAHIVDVNREAAEALARRVGATVATAEAALADPAVGAVIIASSTDTHADLIIRAAGAGKAIFCEKPIDLALARVDAALAAVQTAGVPLMVGFNRRFDPDFSLLHAAIAAGRIGRVEQVVITSRDPGPPPLDYIRVSGGQLRDMTIHDFDMARWLLGEEPVEVFAYGAALVDAAIGAAGDTDSLMLLLKTASGRMAHINNCRRASYGYDQRIEVFGSEGRLIAGNRLESTVELADARGQTAARPMHFFLERYAEAYRIELDAFIDAVTEARPVPVDGSDGRQALLLADCAARALAEGRPVRIPPR